MTRCNLLNIARIKQIIPRSQIWSYGSSVSQLVQSSYSWHKARHKGNQVGNQGLQVLVLGQQSFHLIQNHGRIFVLLRPVKSSKIVEQGEPTKTRRLDLGVLLFICSPLFLNP